MFGGIAAAGSDRILFATVDGDVLTLDVESGDVVGEFSRFPVGPSRVHVSACATAEDGTILLADMVNRCVRRFSPDGIQLERIGHRATPGVDEDEEGIIVEPCALLPLNGELLIGCGGLDVRHGVQGAGGRFVGPEDRWQRVHGLARVGEEQVWVAETEAGLVHAFHVDGRLLWRTGVPRGRPFRIAFDGFEGVLIVFAPETDEQEKELGVGRLSIDDGAFEDWVVLAGEEPGQVYAPFDLAVLPDGRFVVADLPTGAPPDVRLQLFSPDGRPLRTFFEDRVDLNAALRAWFARQLKEGGAYERARVHHHFSGGTAEAHDRARALYREVLAAEPDHLLARLEIAALSEPPEAEEHYRVALERGIARGDIAAKIAECREAENDYDGAIEILQNTLESADPPEEYHHYLEVLGTWFLRRAGED